MTDIAVQPASHFPVQRAGRWRTPGRTLRNAFRQLWLARRTRAELGMLSDVELKDIGLFRGDIERVAMQVDNLR